MHQNPSYISIVLTWAKRTISSPNVWWANWADKNCLALLYQARNVKGYNSYKEKILNIHQ